ncbi:hypothetical protein ACWCYY_17300 [Kitasatospora sp. NPDC001664]
MTSILKLQGLAEDRTEGEYAADSSHWSSHAHFRAAQPVAAEPQD